MLRRRSGDRKVSARQAVRLPPVQLDDAFGLHAPGLEVHADSERSHERQGAFCEFADGRIVEVVVMVVRDDDEIYRGHCPKGNGHRLKALRARKPRRRGAPSPDRIGEHAQAVDLDQHGGMAEPGGTQPARGRLGPGCERAHRWQRPARHAALAAAEKLVQRRHRGVRISQARNDRLQIAELLACPARRSLDALEPRTLRPSSQRSHLYLALNQFSAKNWLVRIPPMGRNPPRKWCSAGSTVPVTAKTSWTPGLPRWASPTRRVMAPGAVCTGCNCWPLRVAEAGALRT